MPRRRQVEVNEATRQTIKDTAQTLMAEKGTAGLSLRAIARELEMTAPALYHYYASLDDLITALIVDAFTNHATHVREARDKAAAEGQSYSHQIYQASLAFRQWFIDNPIQFQLTYGNPIPGYTAPSDVTTPAARLVGQIFMESILAGIEAGEIMLDKGYDQVPETIRMHYQNELHIPADFVEVFHAMNHAWGTMHGIVALEIYNHAQPVVADVTAFYKQAIHRVFTDMGLVLGDIT
ncbi:MAG: TetR/AcrR family transcriptional regulator [Chloroflexota bacterium]